MAKPMATKMSGGISYRRIHDEIIAVRARLEKKLTKQTTPENERIIAAIRNLDVARVLLECNQSLNPIDYHPKPWTQLAGLDRRLGARVGAKKK